MGTGMKKCRTSGWQPHFFQYLAALSEGTLGVTGCQRSAVNLAQFVFTPFLGNPI